MKHRYVKHSDNEVYNFIKTMNNVVPVNVPVVIVVKERRDDIMAYIDGHKEIWGCGKNQHEAIGDLVLFHPKDFNVAIKDTLFIKKEDG